MRRALARALSPHHVRLASNGLEAIEAIALEEPDVIVSDLHMPEMNGLDLFAQVDRQWPHLARRFIFLTGTSSLLDAAHERAPTTPLVRKPFAIGDLENAIRACVRPEAKGA